jgi:hypothetical protein
MFLPSKILDIWLLEKDEFPEIVMYEPFTDKYWKEKYKIVFCNLEPGQKLDDNKEENKKKKDFLNLYCFKYWLEKKNPTIKKSAQFIYYLYNKLHGTNIDFNQLNKVDNNQLLDIVERVTYMNLLRDAGNSKFNKKIFTRFFYLDDKYQKFTKNFIDALSPDIFIISSEEGSILIEKLFGGNFVKTHFFKHDNTLFVSISHPSRLNDSQFIEKINIIMDNIQK